MIVVIVVIIISYFIVSEELNILGHTNRGQEGEPREGEFSLGPRLHRVHKCYNALGPNYL